MNKSGILLTIAATLTFGCKGFQNQTELEESFESEIAATRGALRGNSPMSEKCKNAKEGYSDAAASLNQLNSLCRTSECEEKVARLEDALNEVGVSIRQVCKN